MRKILVVVDMQNDFINGALGSGEAEAVVKEVVKKIKEYPAEDVMATKDTHGKDYLSTKEGSYLPVEHCIKGTEGWEIQADIKPLLLPENIIEKPSFGSLALADRLCGIAEKEKIEVELVGLCTDICVVTNALLIKSKLPEITVKVDSSCCAGVTATKHEAALETMRSCQIEVF